jgi:hypothetical protein
MNSNSHFLYWYNNIENVNSYEIKWHISDFIYVGAILNMHIFRKIVKLAVLIDFTEANMFYELEY